MKKIVLLLVAVFAFSACTSQQIASEEDSALLIGLTLEEVAKHSTPEDCWFVIDGKVYDVSGFGSSGHGGGEAVYEGCGIDATELFETRPMGSGTPHSEKARGFLSSFEIGELGS